MPTQLGTRIANAVTTYAAYKGYPWPRANFRPEKWFFEHMQRKSNHNVYAEITQWPNSGLLSST